MQTTGIFTTHTFDIHYTKFDEPFYLIPFGDVHRSSPACDEERWTEMLRWGKKKPRCYWLGIGDYDDLASASERFILGDRRLHDSTAKTIEALYLKHTQRFAKEIGFMRDRIIGLHEGNHYGEFPNGTTTTQKLAELMGCKYLGVSSFIRLRFINKSCKYHNVVDIWTHHGKSGGRTSGSSLNPVERMMGISEADVYLMGHDHRKTVAHKSRLRLVRDGDGIRIVSRTIILGRTGGFLKGYETGTASYVADGAYDPCELGVIKIEMTPKRDRRDGRNDVRIDLHASV
jgi:hypothetical protein